ncbi:MAG: sulfur carrier protein ThiS [Acetobacter sp.]|jgi:sulfur carrier protein
MQIFVNDEPVTVGAANLAEVLTELGYTQIRIATAVNGDFVPASQRAARLLVPGARIEIVAPMQGG